jgi:putative ABC transport system permease protein
MTDDVRTAYRSLRKSPTFTIVALTVMGLGIGAATAIYSVVDAVVLRGLPFEQHDRLAVVLEHDLKRPTTFGNGATTPQAYADWRRLQQSFEGLAAFGSWTHVTRGDNGEPVDIRGNRISAEFLRTLRVDPILGRHFTRDDEIEGRHRVALISYGFWLRRFGGSADAVGRTIDVDQESLEVVGVLPRTFAFPVASDRPSEIFTPIYFRTSDLTRGSNRSYNWTAIGRLKPGITIPQAQDEMVRISHALDKEHPGWSVDRTVRLVSLHHHLVGRVRSWMLMLLGAVMLVLLIACANVANLLLARATARSREMGVRAALGASRWRLVRGLLVEGLLLSLTAGAIGVALANLGVDVIRAWLPAGVPRVAQIGIDVRVLAAAIGAAVVTGVTFGLVPAFHSARPNLTVALKDTGRSSTAGRSTQRLRSALVVAEIALAVVLLVGAGLFIGSFARLQRIDLGLDYHNVLALNVNVRVVGNDFATAFRQGAAHVDRVVRAVRDVPGVDSVAAVSGGMPLTSSWSRSPLQLPDGRTFDGDDSIDRRIITPDYLRVLRIPLIRGRYLSESDHREAPRVALVNEAAAAKYWPGRDPVGERFTMNKQERVIVGVVANVSHLGPEVPPRPETYLALAQEDTSGATLAIRTSGDPLTVLPAVKAAIWSINKEQRLTPDTYTREGYLDRMIAQRRFNMALLALFGGLGLIIAAVGINGVMAYLVAQRTNEIGVRMALGATRANVVVMILRRAGVLTALGLALGTLLAWPLSTYFQVSTFLFQVEPTDIVTYAVALSILAVAGLAASAIPAHRAATVDPLAALRHE